MHASSLRYSAAHLFYAFALTAASTALFGWLGLPVAAFILLVWWQVIAGVRRETHEEAESTALSRASEPIHRSAYSKAELLIALLIIGMLIGLLVPASSDSDPMRHTEISMKMVVHALKEYEAAHGSLPPLVLTGEDGQPAHSWRALILPFLDEEPLASAYRFEESWNSPHNASLASYRPWHFRAYYPHHHIDDLSTSLQAFSYGDSLVLFEHEDLVSHWLEPTNYDASVLAKFQDIPDHEDGFWNRGFFSSSFRGRLMVDATNSYQVHPTSAENIQAALASPTPNDEPHQVGSPHSLWHLGNAFRLTFFLIVALYPLRWLHCISAKSK